MSENGNEVVKTSTPEPTTAATTNKETRNTRRGNIKGNFRRGKEGEQDGCNRRILRERRPS